MNQRLIFWSAMLLLITSLSRCGQTTEPWRPAFHFTPPAKWMNDPNGLVYHKGKYHLFYQHYPEDIVWGPMHWGHAESEDLIHWNHLPIALYPDSLGWIFSGSAVIDKNNTAGFGQDAMIAIFTHHNDAIWKSGRKNTESQGIAYSLDEGRTWTKYAGNPVLNNSGEQDFRDPKVSWNTRRNVWIMVLAAGDRIKIYSSPNLKQWTFESDFLPEVKEPYGVWECPDLFPVLVGEEEKWVLILSQNQNGPNGGSATRYLVGDFDGSRFTAITSPQWIDQGMDYYAAVTYDNAPDGKRILLGWMSNWLYADKTPTQTWRSAMALPRELTLRKTSSGYALSQSPVTGLDGEVRVLVQKENVTEFGPSKGDFSVARIQLELGSMSVQSKLELFNDSGEQLIVEWRDSTITLDRSHSGVTDFSPHFAGKAQVMTTDEPIRQLELILDKASVELSVNGGQHWMTAQYFPVKPYSSIHIQTGGMNTLKISTAKK
jgi:fructan beta-fructosidase